MSADLSEIELTFTQASRILGYRELPSYKLKRYIEYGLLRLRISREHGRGRHRMLTGADLVRVWILHLLEHFGINVRSSPGARSLVDATDETYLSAPQIVFRLSAKVKKTGREQFQLIEGHWNTGDDSARVDTQGHQLVIAVDIDGIRHELEEAIARGF